jgi:hypothetical protein
MLISDFLQAQQTIFLTAGIAGSRALSHGIVRTFTVNSVRMCRLDLANLCNSLLHAPQNSGGRAPFSSSDENVEKHSGHQTANGANGSSQLRHVICLAVTGNKVSINSEMDSLGLAFAAAAVDAGVGPAFRIEVDDLPVALPRELSAMVLARAPRTTERDFVTLLPPLCTVFWPITVFTALLSEVSDALWRVLFNGTDKLPPFSLPELELVNFWFAALCVNVCFCEGFSVVNVSTRAGKGAPLIDPLVTPSGGVTATKCGSFQFGFLSSTRSGCTVGDGLLIQLPILIDLYV